MQNDFKAMIEKYKADLLKYHSENPQGGEAERYTAEKTEPTQSVAPKTEPDMPEPLSVPEVPDLPPIPVEAPGMPIILPGEPMTEPAPQVLEQSPDSFEGDGTADNDLDADEGYLQIRAVTAEGAVPLKNALAVITHAKSGKLAAQVLTDTDGLSAAVPLPTLSRSLSEVEGNNQPYDTYNIEISLDGFYKVKSENVPVFGGVTNLQTVSLIPLAEFAEADEEYVIDSPDYTL